MRIVLILLLATFVTAGEEKKSPLERLAKTGVASPAIGFGAAPSDFFEIFKELRKSGDDGLAARLLKDDRPVFRCMGLNLLVELQGKAAVPELDRRLGDRETVRLTMGCVMSTTTVAGVARRLLNDPRVLGARTEAESLLPKDALRARDLRILVRDDMVVIRRPAGRDLWEVLESGSIELPELRKRLPGESDSNLVKALGRTLDGPGRTRRVEEFLVRLGGDPKQARDIRLAAISGVLRAGKEEARKAVTENAEFLKECGEARLLGRSVRRFALKKLSLAAVEGSPAVKRGDPAALRAIEMVIVRLQMPDRPVPKWVTPALGRIVTRAEAGFPAWDPDSDLRYRLEAFLWMKGPWLKKHAPSKALTEIEARVAKLVAK